ncbi:hypothetical protein DPMN_096267 [Dreissena polymorpha]|uniref:Uncharacterized protein n=1 Tax=Dreissena polymorpha TaxID=45954 RepID=A0A9D4L945_DREPO|nr:hypothetical protein DPMN_096267 [Dreissena polymorpha]
MWRADGDINGGGLIAYLRSDIAGERKPQLEFDEIESIFVEVNFDECRWLILGTYKPPSMSNQKFQEKFDYTLEKAFYK